MKDRLKDEQSQNVEQLKERYLGGASGSELNALRTSAIDRWVSTLALNAPAWHPEKAAVIALGGYGRGEMCLNSDIDLLILYSDDSGHDIKKLADQILYPLWDASLDIGCVTRTLHDCKVIFSGDIRAQTSLLDARLLVGSIELFEKLKGLIDEHRRNGRWRKQFIDAKLGEHNSRIKRFGGTIYLGEPHVKEGEGGLREFHTALWIAHVMADGDWQETLEYDLWQEHLDFLWRVRFGLHLINKTREDRLKYDEQEQIAASLNMGGGEEGKAGKTLLMQQYYYHAAHMHRLNRRVVRHLVTPRRSWQILFRLIKRASYGHGVIADGNRIALSEDAMRSVDHEAIKNVWQAAAKFKLRLNDTTKDFFRNASDEMKRDAVESKVLKTSFLDLFRQGRNVTHVLRQMHDAHYLEWVVPEYTHLYYQVQENAYHIFTVDEHALRATEEMERLLDGHFSKEFPVFSSAAKEITQRDLMLLTGFLHDIGKGLGGYHPHVGAKIIKDLAKRLELNEKDTLTLSFLVESHLIMAQLSFYRDTSDPHLIAHFATAVDNLDNLNMLFALAFADIRSIGPGVWSDWKRRLLEEMYKTTRQTLATGGHTVREMEEKQAEKRAKVYLSLKGSSAGGLVDDWLKGMSERYLLTSELEQIVEDIKLFETMHHLPSVINVTHRPGDGISSLKVIARDAPGLFSKIAAVMAANGLNILDAQLNTGPSGYIADRITVTTEKGLIMDDPGRWNYIINQLQRVIAGDLDVGDVLVRRRQSLLKQTVVSRPPLSVNIDNDVSAYYTVIDIATEDRVGLLYDIAHTLFESGCSIDMARATTHAGHVIDVFYVKNKSGEKIVLLDAIAEIKKKLIDALYSAGQ